MTKSKLDTIKALGHLEFSYRKILNWNLARAEWSEEELETLESFSSRFARSSDLIISRLLSALAQGADPAFRGTLIDLLNFAEKNSWIEWASTWLRIRELGNVAAHEYTTDQFNKLILELIKLTPALLATKALCETK